MKNSFRSMLVRIGAMVYKEWQQMRRDRLTFGMLIGIPVIQLILFGYAVNLQPKHLPFAVHSEEHTDITRSIIATMTHSDYFDLVIEEPNASKTTALLQAGKVNYVLSIPAGFSQAIVRGERPSLLLEIDASDPATSGVGAYFSGMITYALQPFINDPRQIPPTISPVNIVVHNVFNSQLETRFNVVPGLLGVIITMTGIMITAITMTRERERGTMENLLAMPVRPFEVMIGKVIPYIMVGLLQSLMIIGAALWLFNVPFIGDTSILMAGLLLFLFTNLTLGFTFSTIATSQLQALQMTFFFFLPSIMLSGFMFTFRGMPIWAQYLGEVLPLTHFLRIIRGVMLKDASWQMLIAEFGAILVFWLFSISIAMLRYKRTLN
ncbi:ABC transporter permease [Pasteurella skyensis]|uniref:ABC transporter permease n=1 Tax=Phocoenobacter skyensis TaxID=97481 RepID=A0AAJ6NBB1_9PAST|nr:ABC transporter permease [Pasteurella skyensis]MDP8163388.1 ABC transporter permease [Pasteurella skyensis]MDP8173630.1 ABC transporter permease [Pasteurella skyensis]MDP8179832.1 ABC transporter permease [Pasteurella skyensis]MDP8183946.1 ABC transporter permease [Pasteurella skyensis]MDP8190140.1 ABC transporter permease [Pasteurella skyensis]